MRLVLIIILFLYNASLLYSINYKAKGGLIYGGPKPTKDVAGIEGTPKLNPIVAFDFETDLWNNLKLSGGFAFSYKGVEYGGRFRRDTIVEVKIGNEIGYVPTFYNVIVNGDISLAYIDLPFLLTYHFFDFFNLSAGVQPSILIGGYDKGTTRIVIGEGGFFQDSLYKFDNYSKINKLDFSLCIGGYHIIYSNLFLQFYATFSIVELYFAETAGSKHVDRGKLYNTYFVGMLGWKF